LFANCIKNLCLHSIESILQKFQPVSLMETTAVKLMNRIDRKFWFHFSLLGPLLDEIAQFYDVLEIDDKRLVNYQSIYFDTPDRQMYLHHHNGFRDRYKIRRRKYETSELGFLEIKRKTNKQRTIKKRIEVPFTQGEIAEAERSFILENSPYGNQILNAVLFNQFNRISLVDKAKKERCTIDFAINLWNENEKVSLENLVILELKRGKNLKSSPIVSVLKEFQIRQKGLSKYCTGRALLEPGIKMNRFKARLNRLQNKILKNQLECLIY
jgi:hypothetical protein